VRARLPDRSDVVERDGVKIAYEVHGDGNAPTVLLAPTWSIVHSRIWKAQVPYLARHFRVVTLDGRGNGGSDRPAGAAGYIDDAYADDIVAVMDATDTDRATLVGLSMGALWSVLVAARHPARVTGLLVIGPATGLGVPSPRRDRTQWADELEAPEGWAKFNRAHWLGGGHDDFLRFFFSEMFVEPHSTKQVEDCVGWGRETDPATLVATIEASGAVAQTSTTFEALCRQVRCPGPGRPRERRPHPPPRRRRTARRGHGGPAPHGRRRWPWHPRARPGADQPPHQGLRRPLRIRETGVESHLDPSSQPSQAGAVHLVADRPRPRPT